MEKLTLLYRQQKIILTLLDAENWRTSSFLSSALNVSDRTIRSDINDLGVVLSKFDMQIISERSKGYKISDEDKKKLRELFDKKIISVENNGEELHKSILIYLITINKSIDIDELSEIFYISRSPLEERIKRIKNILQVFNGNVFLQRKNNTIQIVGDEKNLRQLLNFLIIENNHADVSLDLKIYANYFDYEELLLVKKIVQNEIKKSEILISDSGIVAITIHIMINIGRIRANLSLSSPYMNELSEYNGLNKAEDDVTRKIVSDLAKHFNIEFNPYEIEAIAYHISFRRYFPFDEKNKISDDFQLTEDVRKVLKEINDNFLIDMTSDDQLMLGLIYHFNTLKQRIDMQINYQNPILSDFKDRYPFVFELALFARKRFNELLKIELNEDEVGFIAIHFGVAMEKLQYATASEKINAVLISHLDYSSSQLLIAKLRSHFSKDVNIYGPYSSFNLEGIWDYDAKIIITTVDLDISDDKCRVITIKPVLEKSDIEKISNALNDVYRETKKFRYDEFFNEEFFFNNIELQNQDECIKFLSKKLCDGGYVNNDFESSVFRREQFSSTGLKNMIAIPHPLEALSKKTAIAVAILKHPINWGPRKAQIVFMIAVKSKDQLFLENFYELIVDLSDDITYVNKIIKSKNFKDFINIIENKK